LKEPLHLPFSKIHKQQKMKKKLFLELVAMVLLLPACHHKQMTDKTEQPIAVRTQKVEFKDYALPVISSGIVSSGKEARLSFKTGGVISRMYVKEGETVHKGQLLAVLNMTEVDAQVTQLQSAYKKAKRDYLRADNLLKDSATTQEQWENANTEMQMSGESLKIASFNKQFSAIYSTVSGRVISKLGNEGEMAAPGAPVYIINSTNEEDWVIRVGVSDKDWARIRLKDKASVTLDAYPGQIFTGIVSNIAQASDQASGTFSIELKINPGVQKFANGLIGKVQISPTITDKVYLIPIAAIHEADAQSGNVFSVSLNKKMASIHKVQVAYILKDMVALRSGLENVQEVVTEGGAYLSDKLPLEIQH
jgi:RND family efflux transporter MFP subunit